MVNTFVPKTTFVESLLLLDDKRLGKQRVECKQLVRAISGETRGWVNHPAARMWRGHLGSLVQYGEICCRVWRLRGFQDSLLPYFEDLGRQYPDLTRPPWWGDARVHLSHQSNLVRKDAAHYRPHFPDVPDDLPYFWPI